MKKYDAIVVGAGPAGSMAALASARNGKNVLIIDTHQFPRKKVCGGLLTPIVEPMLLEKDLHLPSTVFSSQKEIGLFYVPPSGLKNGKELFKYKLSNIKRDMFDYYLLEKAEDEGAQFAVMKFLGFDGNKLKLRSSSGICNVESDLVIGADGAFSRVRKSLNSFTEHINVLQVGVNNVSLKPNFYIFYSREFSSFYAYLIPKDDKWIAGIGGKGNVIPSLNKFIKYLIKHKIINGADEKKEGWAIPYGEPFLGANKVLLVGEAAGFANPFTGEGIRLAINSGIYAGKAPENYMYDVQNLVKYIKKMNKYVSSLDNKKLEKFVASVAYI